MKTKKIRKARNYVGENKPIAYKNPPTRDREGKTQKQCKNARSLIKIQIHIN